MRSLEWNALIPHCNVFIMVHQHGGQSRLLWVAMHFGHVGENTLLAMPEEWDHARSLLHKMIFISNYNCIVQDLDIKSKKKRTRYQCRSSDPRMLAVIKRE